VRKTSSSSSKFGYRSHKYVNATERYGSKSEDLLSPEESIKSNESVDYSGRLQGVYRDWSSPRSLLSWLSHSIPSESKEYVESIGLGILVSGCVALPPEACKALLIEPKKGLLQGRPLVWYSIHCVVKVIPLGNVGDVGTSFVGNNHATGGEACLGECFHACDIRELLESSL
jgi:hypothetical protein